MKLTGNTILITGGGSGIGRGLAEALHALGNKVIITGRRKQVLEETVAANSGMAYVVFNVEDPASIRSLAAQLTKDYPALNVLINNAGIMRPENVAEQADLTDVEATITTNLLGPIRLITALMPLFKKQPHATIINVSSGLATVPLALTPTYCATKAAIHSYTQSLRYQLRESSIEVLELIPPYVGTEIMPGASSDARAMPLDKFIAEVMDILKNQPSAIEICVETVKPLRFAAENGNYATVFQHLNSSPAVDSH